ncbi:MAG TPA: hypothetical protein DIC53_11085 [Synergistaceae bacterium]|jgi:4-hydroxy-2-oxoheptanedioate aldolase|nr:hypothetical protein [Synergistaceae bacterium]
MRSIKELLKKNGPVIGLYISSSDPSVVEFADQAGFDFIRIDYEHALLSYSELRELVRVATLIGMYCQVRVSNLHDVTKLLDFGVNGIVVPDVNDVRRAREAVMATKFYPFGARGMFPIGRCVKTSGEENYGKYVGVANDIVSLTVQIEDVRATECLDEIASMEGVDMLASGKADISQSLGIPGKSTDPRVIDFEKLILDKAIKHGKQAALMVGNKKSMNELFALGCKVFTVGPDEVIIGKAFKDLINEYRDS